MHFDDICILMLFVSWQTQNNYSFQDFKNILFYVIVMRVPGQGLEQSESGKALLYLQIIIILISCIIIYYK